MADMSFHGKENVIKNMKEIDKKIEIYYIWKIYKNLKWRFSVTTDCYIWWPCLVLRFCYNWLLYMVTMFSD
jgi:hypothetical protein